MKTSLAGRNLIKQREGVRLKAYQDSVGIWTIGVGHTSAAGGLQVKPGMVITMADVEKCLDIDILKFEKAVNDSVKKPMTQNQFDAMVSLSFNIGPSKFASSSVVRLFNQGNIKGSADAILMWKNAGGKPILLPRRQAERTQFLS